MMIAIEEEKLHLRHIDEKAQPHADAKDSAKGGAAEGGPKKWWQTVPRYSICDLTWMVIFNCHAVTNLCFF